MIHMDSCAYSLCPSHTRTYTHTHSRIHTHTCTHRHRLHFETSCSSFSWGGSLSPSCLAAPCSSSTFKDPERASLRDSGHGDSDQADSDQDTNKGSCCDMSAKEALTLKG